MLTALVTALTGLLVAIGICLLVEIFNDSLRNEQDVTWFLNQETLLKLPWEKQPPRLSDSPSHSFEHAMSDFKIKLGKYRRNHVLNSLLITSSLAHEGKSTAVTRLGGNLARSGFRVLLVDADLYRPTLSESLGVDQAAGLTDVLNNDKSPAAFIHETAVTNLHLLPAGLLPSKPFELVENGQLEKALAQLHSDYDLILVDSPPINAVPEVGLLANQVDAVSLVVRSSRTSRQEVRQAMERLETSGGNLLGIMLSGMHELHEDYRYYGAEGKLAGKKVPAVG